MKDNSFYVVQGWMINKLKLKGNNLHVFAVIYGFSKDEKSVYNGGNKYLCESVGATKNTVIKSLKFLEDAGLIIKQEKVVSNVTFNEFYHNAQGVQKLVGGSAETAQIPGAETAPNNIPIHNIDNNKKATTVPVEPAQEATDLFGKAPNPNKKTIFENSAYFDINIFKKKLKDVEVLGVDIEYYHRAINNWSTSKYQKRTAKGWVATARTWMEKDKDKGKLRIINDEPLEATNSDMSDYLNM